MLKANDRRTDDGQTTDNRPLNKLTWSKAPGELITLHSEMHFFKGSIFLKNRLFFIQERFNKLIHSIKCTSLKAPFSLKIDFFYPRKV